MTIEDHPHVIRSKGEFRNRPYVLRINDNGLPMMFGLTEEDLLILHATCDRILKEGEE